MNQQPEPTEEKVEEGLDYVSKSRLKTYKTCPRKFYLKYWCENRPPETMAMKRGSEVHRIFEKFHENIIEYASTFSDPSLTALPERWWGFLPESTTLQFLDPYVGNFWKFEYARRAKSDTIDEYLPCSVEEHMEP